MIIMDLQPNMILPAKLDGWGIRFRGQNPYISKERV